MATRLETVQWRVRTEQVAKRPALPPTLPMNTGGFDIRTHTNTNRYLWSASASGHDVIPADLFKASHSLGMWLNFAFLLAAAGRPSSLAYCSRDGYS